MLARTPLAFLPLFALAVCACDRSTDPSSAAPTGDRATSVQSVDPKARRSPRADRSRFRASTSRHDSDLPDSPLPHPPSDNATHIKAWHLLIAYKGAKNADPKVTRSRDEAKALAEHVGMQARAGADLSALALKYSDDPNVKTNKGNLGELSRTSMVKPSPMPRSAC